MADPIGKIIESYDPKASLAEASTPPASWYTDPRVLELEQRTVFAHSWQMVGRADQVIEVGRYVTCEIGGEPILVVRGNDNVLRAFYNVCRHHAAAVLPNAEGKVQNIRCPYHGWTYDLKGNLVFAPEFGGVANFDRAAHGLLAVQIAAWRNWIWVKLEPEEPSLEAFLGADLIRQFEQLNLEQLHWFERRVYTLHCNWKVFVDNYLDGGYHVPHIHDGLSSVLDYGNYTIESGERHCLQSSPIVTTRGKTKTARVRKGNRALYYWIYPNLMINIYAGVMDTNLVMPRGIDKTEVIFDYYFADTSDRACAQNLASIAVSEQIQTEDRAICESVQRGLRSRSYDSGRLSVRREAGEHLFHRLLYADLHAGLSGNK